MKRLIPLAALLALTACTSMETAPKAPSLPEFTFSSLRGVPTMIVVLDQRSGKRDPEWKQRLEADLKTTLSKAGATVAPESETRFEVRLLKARSDFGRGQWEGCVELTGRVLGPKSADAAGSACVEKANLWGVATASNVLRLAYEDALTKLLSALDSAL